MGSDRRVLSRLLSKIEIVGECWNWTGATFRDSGYGAINVGGQAMLAHRVSFLQHGLGNPGELFVCHRCDNRLCINPSHLFLGTNRDNVDDMLRKGRQCRGQPRVDAALSAKRVALRKLTEEEVRLIFSRHAAGEDRFDLAAEFGVHHDTVYKLLTGHTWSHVTGVPCPRHTWNEI